MADSLAFYNPAQAGHGVVEGAPLDLLLVVVRALTMLITQQTHTVVALSPNCSTTELKSRKRNDSVTVHMLLSLLRFAAQLVHARIRKLTQRASAGLPWSGAAGRDTAPRRRAAGGARAGHAGRRAFRAGRLRLWLLQGGRGR